MDALLNRISQSVNLEESNLLPLKKASMLSEVYTVGDRIVTEGDITHYMFVIEKGWALRYRILDDGRRQILNFMIPGDCFDLMSIMKSRSDHSVSAATTVQLRRIKSSDFLDIIKKDPKLTSAFWSVAIQEEAVLREQITRIGRRTATERLAHMLLELNQRIARIEGELSDFLKFPITQSVLADALGLSVVHISRTMTKLQRMKLIQVTSEGVYILDRNQMIGISGFDENYLDTSKLKLAG